MATQPPVSSLMLCFVASLLLVSFAQLSSGIRYKIEGERIKDYTMAMDHLQVFLADRVFDKVQRCQRITLVLYEFNNCRNPKGFNQFDVATVSAWSHAHAANRYKMVEPKVAVKWLMQAIVQYREKGRMGPPVIELIECLKTEPFDLIGSSRKFVNEVDLRRIVEQYDSIVEQPMNLLTEEGVYHPDLRLDELDDQIKSMVTNWLGGDEGKMQTIFTPFVWYNLDPEAENRLAHDRLFNALIELYNGIPQGALLPDVCPLYKSVLTAPYESLIDPEFTVKLVKGLMESLAKRETSQSQPVRVEATDEDRTDFLLILYNRDFRHIAESAWYELDQCARDWLAEHKDVVRYLQDEERILFKEACEARLQQAEEAAYPSEAYAYGQVAPAPGPYQPQAPVHYYPPPPPAQPQVPAKKQAKGPAKKQAKGPAKTQAEGPAKNKQA